MFINIFVKILFDIPNVYTVGNQDLQTVKTWGLKGSTSAFGIRVRKDGPDRKK